MSNHEGARLACPMPTNVELWNEDPMPGNGPSVMENRSTPTIFTTREAG